MAQMRIGVDVGGTNTDAVLMAGTEVLSAAKTSTTADVTTGAVAALSALRRSYQFDSRDVQAIVVGTTHFINAFVQARGLAPTAVVRLGLPATSALPPLVDWPQELRDVVGGQAYLCHGGHEFDGRSIDAPDVAELTHVAEDLERQGTRAVAISSVFSPVDASMERRAAQVLTQRLPNLQVSLSNEIGRMGLLERENATAINASLGEVAGRIADALGGAVEAAGLTAPIFFTQNNGTLMDVEYARRYPVATFACGPTNSLRGAAFLAGIANCIVVDVGGTTTDIGMVIDGFPREASGEVSIAGIRTNLRMPHLISHDMGGGSVVVPAADPWSGGTPRADRLVSAGRPVARATVGPESVGNELTKRALIFGGDSLTVTDVAVAAGRIDLGNAELVAGMEPDTVADVLDLIAERVAASVARLRTSPAPLPIVLVGGGAMVLRDDRLPGRVVRPAHFAVANAIGAATAEPGGEVERIFCVAAGDRDLVLDQATAEATALAVAAGAQPGTIRVTGVDSAPIAYLPGNATWVRVRTSGELPTADRRRQHAGLECDDPASSKQQPR